jgi:VCBS repeat-containing protein
VPGGTLIANDTDEENDDLFIGTTAVVPTVHGQLTLNRDGTFEYRPDASFTGVDQFTYALFDKNEYHWVHATVVLDVFKDTDQDNIADDMDLDIDGDGIMNEKEVISGQDWHTQDTDKDGLPNSMDIDSDGDGIVDNYEAQNGKTYRSPVGSDVNNNGLDDAYDNGKSGIVIQPVDLDDDGLFDFLDDDSDNDGVPDMIEGHDSDFNGRTDPGHLITGNDADGDGLDNAFDTVFNECGAVNNMTGSNAAMQNFDKDELPDWRDSVSRLVDACKRSASATSRSW